MIGKTLGPYEIVAQLGAGGMGEVWKARDARLGRTVAIKILNKEHMQRFEQEARAIAALNHPHICTLHDIGPDYLVMEYVDGAAIKGPLPVEQAVRMAIQIAGALAEAHKRGILHRDLKPGNIMVMESGATKLLDFGLAKLAAGTDSETASTIEGTVMGTPAYMSPEQAQGKPADARSDIFSFGAVLYEIISGNRPFEGDFYSSGVKRRVAGRAEAAADVAAVGAHSNAVPGKAACTKISDDDGSQVCAGAGRCDACGATAIDCSAALRQHERRQGAGIFQRRAG
jgi:eukaryotic-like serine/threonine-protein kinase